jgi:adenosine deaminase
MMYSLLHCHFESALRAVALVKPQWLHRLEAVCSSPVYTHAAPADRLYLLWNTVQSMTDDSDLFTEATFRAVVQRFADEMAMSHVEHVDLRIGVLMRRWAWMRTASDGIDAFRDELGSYNDLSVSFLAGVDFTKPQGHLDRLIDTLTSDDELIGRLAGVDINLLPGDLPKFDRHLPALRNLQNSGLKVNMHLGELFDNTVSRHLLSQIIPDRIGHGVRLLEDPNLVDLVREHGICLDMCPTSNTTLGVVDWYRISPARHALERGIPVSINTDDPMLFNTTLDSELRLSGLTDTELDQVAAYGRKHRYDAT